MQEPVEFGDYRLTKRLAVSSMSEVFLAFPLKGKGTRKPLVVKRLLEEVASVDSFVNLFHNEADITANMSHPNIVEFLEFGEHDGRLFLAMEYVDGLDLWRLTRRLKRQSTRFSQTTAIYVICEVLRALGYIHSLEGQDGDKLNIVHHDVSPSNILIGRNSEVKLGDFGIAYSEQKELQALGRKFKGKVYYLSPEQVRGDPVDHRSDLYSACVVLVELMLGKRPFDGPTDLSIIINVRDRHSPVLAEGLSSMKPEISEVIDKAMAIDPDDRFQTAEELREALLSLLKPGQLDKAVLDVPDLMQSVLRSTDGVKGLRVPRKKPGFDIYKAITDSKPIDDADDIDIGPTIEEVETREDADSEMERTPATPTGEVSDYMVQHVGGEVVGSLALSDVIEGIICGRIHEDDLVSIDGKPFEQISTVTELSKHLPSVTPTERVHDLGLPDRRGLLTETPAVSVFMEIYSGKESGLLLFECSSIRKDVFLEDGTPRYVSSNLASELLGEYLVRHDIISRMELDMALAVLDKFDGRLGDTLLGLDILDSISLLRAITNQIKERLYDIYRWEAGEFHFYRKAKPVPKGFRLSVEPLELIKEGCISSMETEDMEKWYAAHCKNAYQIGPDAAVPLEQWKFSTSYGILLSELESPRHLEDIMGPYEHASTEVRDKLLRVLKFGLTVGLVSEI